MNKTNQIANNTYINYWTEAGLEAKETNSKQKISTDTNKYLHHPKLDELTFETKTAKLKPKLSKEERFKELPFSNEHNLLVANTYSKENRLVKQQAAEAAHETKIKKLIESMKEQKRIKAMNFKRKGNENFLVIYRNDSKGLPYAFSTNPSKKSLDELYKIGKKLSIDLSEKMSDYASIRIYSKEGLINDTPRYYIYGKAAQKSRSY